MYSTAFKFLGKFRIVILIIIISSLVLGGVSIFRNLSTPTKANVSALTDFNFPLTDDTVFTKLHDGETTYIGGQFQRIGDFTGFNAPVDVSTSEQEIIRGHAKANAWIHSSVSDGEGGWYVGGDFTKYGGLDRVGLAHILEDGSVDPDWRVDVTGNWIEDMAFDGTYLYVGGRFDNVDGQTRNYLASINVETEEVTAWDPNPNFHIHALQIHENILYVGGNGLNTIAGESIVGVAAFDVSTGTPTLTSWAPEVTGIVMDFEVVDNDVYMGGWFDSVNSEPIAYLAAVDKTTGDLKAWDPDCNFDVYSIEVDSDNVYVGGIFSLLGGQARTGLGAVSRTTGLATSWNPNPDSATTSDLLLDGDDLYVSSGFENINGEARRYFAVVDKNTGAVDEFDPMLSGSPDTMVKSGDSIFLGGNIELKNAIDRHNIAAINNITGDILDFDLELNNTVWDMEIKDNILYIAGDFTSVQGQTRNRIAAIDLGTGNVTDWNPNSNNRINRLALGDDNIIYAIGSFTQIGGLFNRVGVVALYTDIDTSNGDDWWNPRPNALGTIDDIAYYDSTVYLSGTFTSMFFEPRAGLAAVEPSGFELEGVPTAWDPGVDNGRAFDLHIDEANEIVYTVGTFTSIGGDADKDYVAGINISDASLTDFDPNPDAPIWGLNKLGNSLYLAGDFTEIGGESRIALAAVDIATSTATDWNPNLVDGSWTELVSFDDNGWIYVAGEFSTYADYYPDIFFGRFGGASAEFTVNEATNAESVTNYNIPIELSEASDDDITINYSVTGGDASSGTDFTLAAGNITITSGNTTGNIPININNDLSVEDDEFVEITMTSVMGGVMGEKIIFDYNIQDDDDGSTPTPTPSPSNTPTPTEEPTPTSTPEATPIPTDPPAVAQNNNSTAPTPTEEPTITPTPTVEDIDTIVSPTVIPSVEPTNSNETPNTGTSGDESSSGGSVLGFITKPLRDLVQSIQTTVEEIVPDAILPVVQEAGVLGIASIITAVPSLGLTLGIEIFQLLRLLLQGGYLLPFITALFLRLSGRKYGRVIDDFTNEGISFVAIKAIDTATGKVVQKSLSTISGRYYLRLKPGSYQLIFSRYDHNDYVKNTIISDTTDFDEIITMSLVESKDLAANVQYRVLKLDPKGISFIFGLVFGLLNVWIIGTTLAWVLFAFTILIGVGLLKRRFKSQPKYNV